MIAVTWTVTNVITNNVFNNNVLTGKLDVAELKAFSETLALGSTINAERLQGAIAVLDKNDDGVSTVLSSCC